MTNVIRKKILTRGSIKGNPELFLRFELNSLDFDHRVEVCRKNKRGENSSGGTQVRDPPSKIYCYPLNLDTVETEAIAAPRNVRVQ